MPFSACEVGKGNGKRGRCEIRLPFLACEVGKGNGKRGRCEIRLPFLACEVGKGNEKRGKSEIRLLVSPTPRKKKKQVITEVKGNAPAAAPTTAGRRLASLSRIFVATLVVVSRAGKSQPELPFRNTVDRLHFRFTKSKKCGTLERDIQRNYKEEWSVTN